MSGTDPEVVSRLLTAVAIILRERSSNFELHQFWFAAIAAPWNPCWFRVAAADIYAPLAKRRPCMLPPCAGSWSCPPLEWEIA